MKSIKRIICAVAAAALTLQSTAFASILGGDVLGNRIQMAQDTYLNKNVFMSEQNGVGLQTEYYCEYAPNENVRPVVVNGDDIFGKRTVMQAAEYMQQNGMQPMIGINADFFSTKTGVPMGHTIIDGKIVTKDATGQDALGFNEDGSAFISWLEISTVIKTSEDSFYIDNINKYRQPGAVPAFLLTNDFGEETQASTWGIDVVLSEIEGDLKLGETLTARIESIDYNEGSIPIPEGKMVLTMDCNGWEETYLKMQNLKVGQMVSITNELVYNDERWLEAESAIGSIGGRLLGGGVINAELNASAAPRTAVGIKPDGTVIFYVLDGRQTGYSYGAKLTTIAKRLAELGCTDAINLDGGGSTSIAGIYPGSGTMSVINSPSDHSLRKVANFIFLQNMQKPSGKVSKLFLYPEEKYYMNGIKEKIDIKAVDEEFYKTEVPEDVTLKITHTDSTAEDGTVEFKGDGEVVIAAESESTQTYGFANVYTYETPTDIVVYNGDKKVSDIMLSMDEGVDLSAVAYAGYNEMKSQDDLFEWSVEGEIGTIDENGLFTAAENPGKIGRIAVKAGEKTVYVNVSIIDVNSIEKYPKIHYTIDEENELVITVTSLGSKIDKDNVNFTIDGIGMDEEEIIRVQNGDNEAQVTYTLPEDFADNIHKIRIDAYNDNEMTSILSEAVGEGEIEHEFSDISSHWAKEVIAYMADKGIVGGMKEDDKLVFKPDDNVTRAQLAVIFCNYLRPDFEEDEEKLPFDDEAQIPKWAYEYVRAMYKCGILNGREKDGGVVFDPNAPVTRAEMITVMGRILPDGLFAAELDEVEDADDIPEWSREAFERMIGAGIISGYDDNTVRPLNNITRAETLKLLYNIF